MTEIESKAWEQGFKAALHFSIALCLCPDAKISELKNALEQRTLAQEKQKNRVRKPRSNHAV